MGNESPTYHTQPRKFSLGYLFFVTTMMAVGLGLYVGPFAIPLKGIGIGLVFFWLSRIIFASSTLLPKVAREIVFLLGLPIYIGSMLLIFWSVFVAAVGVVETLIS